ncbi:PTS sugar transporter subunit IIA [Buttiauxella sp. WJP83]|uniref:PTS sugar transporter subunit IIA n=1 Tax=Buttiauxella selenatireducens TaxID=3073902 RepID=A0ABY9S934_9ENTR|nr:MULTISPECIES: PTS sugar transporter subunit IIA [unclassified Buttiauxella]WBM69987.1 PTS sugar transporter subunit IIA [Buttiauxella sp. WJP83]WMY73676.1 PTS sugar transporter subunit IIA [Buttiauxella sp. R73]GDX07683.1 PTS sugar transporter subunit IIA [Buttiauxella sp. A111]
MLGWVIAGHDYYAQDMLDAIERRFGPQAQCCSVNYWKGLSTNMLSRMMCDALYNCDSGDGVVFLTDQAGAAPYRTAALISHQHTHCEVISGVTLPVLFAMRAYRTTLTSEAFRDHIVEHGGGDITSLWHQQQKNPPFVLLHHY